MTGETKTWIWLAIEALALFGGMVGVHWHFRRHRRRMSDRIYYQRTLPAGSRRILTLYPGKLTEAEQQEVTAIEARLLELAETAEEEMPINLKEDK